jgi:hypothetical protein
LQEDNGSITLLAQWILRLDRHPIERRLVLRALDEYIDEGQVSAALARRIVLGRFISMPTLLVFWVSSLARTRTRVDA